MLFNFYEFIFAFLPITLFIYFYLNPKRLTEASKGFLVFSSLFFYCWWNIVYLSIILTIIARVLEDREPKDFAVLVTGKNIELHLKKLRNEVKDYDLETLLSSK